MSKYLYLLTKKVSAAEFDGWITRYHAMVYKHAFWMTGNQDLAQEMTQEAFFQAWTSRHKLKDREKAYPWLLTILRRAVYREQRHRYRHVETMNQLKQQEQEQSQSDASTLLQIYMAFESLTPKLRETLLLHQLHGFSYEEISQQLDIPVGTVMSRLSRARDALQKQHKLEDEKIIAFDVTKRGQQSD